jgi:NAD(P)-dependent dehydrogenase (short-subunit alcohol dehydrogenase family)
MPAGTFNWDGKVAVVTGASSGIGAATALRLARLGADVVGAARRADRLEETMEACRRHRPASFGQVTDVSRREDCERLAAVALDRLGRIDVIVNNAGVSLHAPAQTTTVEEIEQVTAINYLGPVYLTMAVLPHLLGRRSGSVINVTSVAGYLPNAREAAYGASKAALSRWTHGLAIDLHATGVHVGVLSPGPILTEIWSAPDEDYRGRMYPPEVVADGVVHMVERRLVHLTVPRRFGAVGALYPLVGRPMRWGIRRYASGSPREPT